MKRPLLLLICLLLDYDSTETERSIICTVCMYNGNGFESSWSHIPTIFENGISMLFSVELWYVST